MNHWAHVLAQKVQDELRMKNILTICSFIGTKLSADDEDQEDA